MPVDRMISTTETLSVCLIFLSLLRRCTFDHRLLSDYYTTIIDYRKKSSITSIISIIIIITNVSLKALISAAVCCLWCLKVDQLVDMMTGCLRCTYCQSELIEEASNNSAGQNDTRSLMAKFNDHFEPIYALLRKVEDIRLSAEILEPEPTDYKPTR